MRMDFTGLLRLSVHPTFAISAAYEVMSPLYICVYDYVHMILVLVYYYHCWMWDDNSVAPWHKTNNIMLPLPHFLSIPQTLMWM